MMSAKVIFPLSLHIVIVVSKFHFSKNIHWKKPSEKSHFKIVQGLPFLLFIYFFFKDTHRISDFVHKLQVHFIWEGTLFSLGKLDRKIPGNSIQSLNSFW